MEKIKYREIATLTATAGILAVAFFYAFSIGVRKEVGRRDKWTCQYEGCDDGTGKPKRFQNGWMVFASHIDTHNKKDPLYNKPETGRIHCIEHEIEFHQGLLDQAIMDEDEDQIRFNERALVLLERVDWRTVNYRREQDDRKMAAD